MKAKPTILIADDEPAFLRFTMRLLHESGYALECVPDGHSALEALARRSYDLLITDLVMPGNLEMELLREGRRRFPQVPVLIVTGSPTLPSAIESVRLGVTDYVLKPFDPNEFVQRVRRIVAQSHSNASAAPAMIGRSPKMQEVFRLLERVAATDASVLITGESGTGKELAARTLHEKSRRSDRPFAIIDCTAIPEGLMESALFGHAKGAFTGAIGEQPGLVSRGAGGSIFFDEIGEMSLPLQSKLLRLVQERSYTPVGKTEPTTIDARFIAATNRDLAAEVQCGRFRKDLFYRLAVVQIEMPPLRERGDDVIVLVEHFLERLAPRFPNVSGFAPDALAALCHYDWPGNVRELCNVVERTLSLVGSGTVTVDDLPERIRSRSPQAASSAKNTAALVHTLNDAVTRAQRDYLVDLLQRHGGNVTKAAKEAQLSRSGLHKLLVKYGLSAQGFRPADRPESQVFAPSRCRQPVEVAG
jgi:DNA-binding NtrC family response regulator